MMKQFFAGLIIVLSSFSLNAQIFEVDTIQYHGELSSYINIVLLGDGYLASELDKFTIDAENIADALMDEIPFSNYKNYFNIFYIPVPSNVTGAAMDPDNLIDNYYGSTYWWAGIERLLVPSHNDKIVNVLANNFPAYDHVVMIVNHSKYGGSGGWARNCIYT